jgi:hypothetical protein
MKKKMTRIARLGLVGLSTMAVVAWRQAAATSDLAAQQGTTQDSQTTGGRERSSPRSPIVASFSLPSVDVLVDQRKVSVDAEAEIKDLTAGVDCMWTLIVKDRDTGDVLSADHFDDQLFQGEGEFGAPRFHHEMDLVPGRYAVELMIFWVRPETNLDELTRQGARHPDILTFRRTEIAIR